MNPVSAQEEDFSITLDDKATKSKYVIDDGTYGARLVDLTKEISKKNNQMYVFHFLGTEGQAEGLEFKARVLTDPQYQWKLVQVLAAFGVKPVARVDATGNPVLKANGKPEMDLPIKKGELVGKRVSLELVAQEFGEGKQSMSVEGVLAYTGNSDSASSSDVPF
jgi:hypothetical protein